MIRSLLLGVALAALPAAAFAQSDSTAPTGANATPAPRAHHHKWHAAADSCRNLTNLVDRGNVLERPCVVKRGDVLIETNYQNFAPDGGIHTVTYPSALIRVGTAINRLEIDVAPPSYVRTSAANGSSDIGFGARYQLGGTGKLKYGVHALFTEPTGLNGASSNGNNASGALDASYTLNRIFSVAGSVGEQSLSNGITREYGFVPSVGLTANVTRNTQLFGEAASFAHEPFGGTNTELLYDFGIEHSFANKINANVNFGRSPTDETGKSRSFGFGLSALL